MRDWTVAEWLKRHRRFDEDFAALMPDNVPTDEQDMWVFAHAGTWPDIARGFNHLDDQPAENALIQQYHFGTWHYVNLPQFLNDAEAAALSPVSANLDMAWTPGQQLNGMNVIQALKRAIHMQHGGMARADKAILMTWIFHLVGDIHQPLHSTALFTTGAFPDGDRGGNRFSVASSNLHARWDSSVATGTTWNFLKGRAAELVTEHGTAGDQAATNLSLEDWANESHMLAESGVYSQAILDVVAANNDQFQDSLAIALDQTYVDQMKDASRRRITEAGYRLAAWLTFFAEQQD